MAKKEKDYKSVRKQIKLTEQINEYLEYYAKHLTNGNQSELVRAAIFFYTQGNRNIVKCLTCKKPVFDLEVMPSEGIGKTECLDGHSHFYDFQEEKWVR